MKALTVNPWKRYQWVKELQKDIEAYQSGFATRAEDAGMVRQMGLLVRRHKMLTFTVMSIFAAIFTASVVGTTQWIKAEQSRKTAEHQRELARDALTALKGSAPDMALLATRYISTQQPEEALKRICFAVEMRPGNADYLCLRGNVLQTMRRLDEARECYRQALKSDPNHKMAQANLELCTQVLARNGKNKDLSAAALRDLYVGISAQNRFDDALLVLGKGRTLESVMRQMLQKSRIYCKNLSVDDKGLCAVDLSNTSVSDLSPLKDIPISRLNLMRTSIFDLSPLKSLPLTSLNIAYTKISDLSPLRGMRLTELNIGQTWVKDISPVKGMPLKFLNLDSLPVKDLSIVKGMPLERLGVHRTDVTDLSPLKDMPLAKLNMIGTQITDLSPLRSTPLRILCIDRNSPADLSALKGMTTLTFFSEYGEGGGDDVALGMLNPAITALDKKDLSRARKEAETVMRDWRGVPAMIPALNAARWMLDFSIPMIEKPNDFPPRALTYEGHHYCDYYLPMKWDDAKKFCESLGGHLVTVASDDEWRWLLDAFPDHTGMWLGGYLDKQAGKWKWVTGEQWNFTDWSTNQPDNHENSEDVVQIFDDNRFNDTKRDRPERFIIEWDR
jgi:tetratricopeptide (TPR) repeat protein